MDDTDARPTENAPPRAPSRATAWVPIAAGFVAVVIGLVARRADVGGVGRPGFGWLTALRRAAMDERTRVALRRAVVGVDRSAVLRLFGPPGATHGPGGAVRSPGRAEYLSADVWFYPLDDARRSAMAVRFREGQAGDAEFLAEPGAGGAL